MSAYSTSKSPVLGIEFVGLPAKSATDHLLAEKLRAEGADAEDVRDGVGVPPSVSIETETTQRICSPSRPGLPTVFITSRRRSWSVILAPASASPGALDDLALELLDLGSCQLAEIRRRALRRIRAAALSIRSVFGRASRCRTGRSSGRAQDGRDATACRLAVLALALPAGNPFVDELEVEVLLQTTMKTGGTSMPARFQRSKVFA